MSSGDAMRFPLVLIALILGCDYHAKVEAVNGLTLNDLQYNPESIIQYTGIQSVQVSSCEKVVVKIEITSRGVGVLRLSSGSRDLLEVPIFDTNEESDVSTIFEEGMHSYRFVDIDGSGVLSLLIEGNILTTQDGAILNRKHRLETYKYNRVEKAWNRAS